LMDGGWVMEEGGPGQVDVGECVKRKRKRQWVPTVSSQTADGRQGSTLAACWLPSFRCRAAQRTG
jgi:hypothetical protein